MCPHNSGPALTLSPIGVEISPAPLCHTPDDKCVCPRQAVVYVLHFRAGWCPSGPPRCAHPSRKQSGRRHSPTRSWPRARGRSAQARAARAPSGPSRQLWPQHGSAGATGQGWSRIMRLEAAPGRRLAGCHRVWEQPDPGSARGRAPDGTGSLTRTVHRLCISVVD